MSATLQDLLEAITASGGASPLVPKHISPILSELVRKFAPLRVAFPRQTWDTDTFYFNQRNALPTPQFVTEAPPNSGAGSVAASVSNYVQKSFGVKHLQANGDVSKFAQKVARVNGSLLNLEMQGATMAVGWLEEIAHLYGHAAATAGTFRPQWDGLDAQIGAANKIDAQTLATNGVASFPMLDAIIDAVRSPYAGNLSGDEFFFTMTPKMQSKFTQLAVQTGRSLLERRAVKPRTDGGVPGNPVVTNEVDPGVEVMSYRGIPIFENSFLSGQGQMGTITIGQGASTTPFLLNAVRYYVVEAVTLYGATLASAEVSITISLAANKVNLSWTTPSILDPYGNVIPVLAYRIYEGATSGSETLIAVVPAFDASDNPVTAWSDLGAAASSTFWQYGANGDGVTLPRAYVTGNPSGYGQEDIYLCSRNPELVVVPVVNEIQPMLLAPVNARTTQFAIVADECLAVRAPLFAAKLQRARFQ